MTIVTAILEFFAPLLIGAIGSFVAFILLLPTKLGERLISHHFEAKLQGLRHHQSIELGNLQSALDHLKDRGIRSNEREFAAVSAVWEAYVEAFWLTRGCVVQFTQFPNLNNLGADEVTEFLLEEDITGRHAKQIINSEDRNTAYGHATRVSQIYKAAASIYKVRDLLQKQCVFIPQALCDQFHIAINILNEVRVEQYMSQYSNSSGELKISRSISFVGHEGDAVMVELTDTVRARLLKDEFNVDRRGIGAPLAG